MFLAMLMCSNLTREGRRKHGPVVSITAVGKKMIYVTSPDLISQVYSSPKVL